MTVHECVRSRFILPLQVETLKVQFKVFKINFTETVFPNYFFCFPFYTPGCLATCVFDVTNCVMPERVSVQMKLDLAI